MNCLHRPVLAAPLLACVLSACPPQRAMGPATGTQDLTLAPLEGGSTPLRRFRGKVVLLDVWATWCEPCQRSLPFYGALRAELAARGFEVLAVSVDASRSDVRLFLEHHAVSFPVFHDPEGSVPASLGASTMPTLVLLDRQGALRWRHGGFRVGDEAMIRQRVLDLLAEPAEAAMSGGAP